MEVWDGIDWVRDEQFSGRFMTPGIGQYSFQIATASCAGNSGADFVLPGLPKTSNAPTFTMIEEKDPLFFLHMGDMHYRDIGTNDVALFRQAFRDTLANARQNSLYRNVPLAYIFDDHDFGPNDAHGFGPQVPAALTTYREYVPHYPFGLEGDPDDTPVCQSFSIGRVRFILLDVRAERHWKTFMPIEDKSMLGPEQKAWLKDELLAFKKAFLAQTELAAVLVVVVPWIGEPTGEPPHTADFWAGFVFERREIANFLHEHGLTENVLLLHGDAHMLAADNGANTQYAEGANTPGPPLWSAAPLDASLSIKGGPYSEGARTVSKQQYSMLEFDDQGGKIVLTMLGFAVDASNEDQPIESLVLSMTAEFVAAGANPADLNCDGVVDGSDLLILLSAWGKCADPEDCPANLNGDGVVDGGDLLILLSNWG